MAGSLQKIETYGGQYDFDIWLQKFEMIIRIAKIEADSKLDYLLTNLELKIFKTVMTAFPKDRKYETVVKFLKDRYSTEDKYLERLEFFNVELKGTFEEFAAQLQGLLETFDEKPFKEQILVARFLTAVPTNLQTELRVRRPQTLSDCIQMCNALQSSQNVPLAAVVGKNENKQSFQKRSQGFKSQNKSFDNSDKSRKCYRCGSLSHIASEPKCPAKNVECNLCNKTGHFSKMCISKTRFTPKENSNKSYKLNINTVTKEEPNTVNSVSKVEKPQITLCMIDDRNRRFYQKFLVDTGADCSILPFSVVHNHFRNRLTKRDILLRNYDQSEINVEGEIKEISCTYQDKSGNVDFVVCDTNLAILGVDAIVIMNLHISSDRNEVTACSIDRSESSPSIGMRDTVRPLESIQGFTFFIKLKNDAPDSIIHKPRRIPFALEQQVENEIANLIKQDIIEEIDHSSFLSPIVVVPKGDGIRLCVDYKRINKHIIIDQHPLPTADEIFAKLSGAKFFSKLDLKSAYHQLMIREDSRDLTAFTCHLGLFRYKRLPFGLANAPSAYMKVISLILRPCKNTISYLDDILVFGSTQEEHDCCLNTALDKLREYNLTVNESKCEFSKMKLKFLGRMISGDGVAPLPDTVKAIQDAASPHNKQSLRSFLGLFNFYRNYVPNASNISAPLFDLLRDNVQFIWTEELEGVFRLLKSRLLKCVPLKFFDTHPSTPTFVTTDASGDGIAAVLTQQDSTGTEKPVYYLSRKLSSVEQTYSATEKEFLAVLWGVERLHQFLYGRPFVVRTDHQCLRQLLTNGVEGGSAPCRVIRWAMRLLYYNFQVEYLPGKKNFVADALSRLPSDDHTEMHLYTVKMSLPADTPVSLTELQLHTSQDSTLQKVVTMIQHGWPHAKAKVEHLLQEFWNVRNDLSYIDGVIYKNEKSVIPSVLRNKIISLAHEGHLGMSKCKSRIREYYWWPYLNRNVEQKIRECQCCREPVRDSPVQVPHYRNVPWHQIAIDIKGPVRDKNHRPIYIIVMIDCYTKFVVTKVVPSVNSRTIIEFMNSVFSILGHCTIVTSDNGPQFVSIEFSDYLRQLGIIHRRSAVYNPQSNGCVERVNRNLQKVLENSSLTNASQIQEEIDTYVLNYNATQHSSTDKTPADMILSFKMKTKLTCKSYTESALTTEGEHLKMMQERRAKYANERRRPNTKNIFEVGDEVITKAGLVRKLTQQVGPFTFRMNDGYTINTRSIKKKLRQNETVPTINSDNSENTAQPNEEAYNWILIPGSAERLNNENDGPSVEMDHTPFQGATPVHRSGEPRKPSRRKKTPSYLGDYVT